MSVFPSIESLLLNAHQALGVSSQDFKLKSEDKTLFADIGLSEKRQKTIARCLLADIQTTFDLDNESTAYFLKGLMDWSNHHKHLELNTWTGGASDRQVAWYLASRSIVPTLARLLAFWDVDGALAPAMPSGQFWFLPTIDHQTGRLELPLPKVLEWLIDLYAIPINQVQQHLGSDDDARQGRQDSLLRNLYNWKTGKLPRVSSIAAMFPDETAGPDRPAFEGAFVPDPMLSAEQLLVAALEFVQRKGLTAHALSKQIRFPHVERLAAVLSGEGTDIENQHLVDLLRIRYAVPNQKTIRQRLLLARAVQSSYDSLSDLFCPGVDTTCADPVENKALQLISLFTRVFNLTIDVHGRVAVPNEQEEDRIFEAGLTPFERHDLLLAIVPSSKHVSYLEVPRLWSRRFAKLSGSEPLEDLMPTGPDRMEEFVRTVSVRQLQELDQDQRVAEVADRCRRSSSWGELQQQGFDVLRRLISMENLPPRARALACERMLEVADSPEQKGEASLQQALNLLSSRDVARSDALASEVDRLLQLADDALEGTHHAPLLLATQAKQLLCKGMLKDAQSKYRKALEACSIWSCGMLRGEIARDLLAIEVADSALPTEEHSSAAKYYRNMMAFGMFEATPPRLEDTAIWAHDYFWTDLFKPYQDTPDIKSPQVVKREHLLLELARDIFRNDGFDTNAWLDRNRKAMSKKRLQDVRGDSVLTFFLKLLAAMRNAAPPEPVARMRSFLLTLISAWPEQVNISDFKAQSPLMLAANDGEVEIARCLLAGGADVNAQDFLGRSPLHAAIAGDSLPCVQLLVTVKPDIELRTRDEGQTVLHTAIRIGNLAVIKLLARVYPDLLSTTNLNGDSPIGEAQELLNHYDHFCAMMASQSRRPPATRAALLKAVAMLKQYAQQA